VLALVAAGVYVVTTVNRVQVPDVAGLDRAAAVNQLRESGLNPVVETEPDGSVQAGLVIGTDPGAGSSISSGGDITVDVSTGPEQRRVPDVTEMSYEAAVRALGEAGFDSVRRMPQASTAAQLDRVIGTIPASGQDSATSNEIVILVGSGPSARDLPDVANQPGSRPFRIGGRGFHHDPAGDADSVLAAGQGGRHRSAGRLLGAQRRARHHQGLARQSVHHADHDRAVLRRCVQQLQSLGITGPLLRGPDVDGRRRPPGPGWCARIRRRAPG
jgi:serine/threonine-protein kinase